MTSPSRPRSNEELLAALTPRAMTEALTELAPEQCAHCAAAAHVLGAVDLPETGLVNRHQAARMLGVSAERVDQYARSGRLPFQRDSAGRRAFRAIDVLAVRRG